MKKRNLMLVLTTLLLVLGCIADTQIIIGTQAQASTLGEQPLEQFLCQVPAKTFEWDYLSFIDYQGAQSPLELVAGFDPMNFHYFSNEDLISTMGFSQTDVHQSMSIGIPPNDQAWLKGTFSPAQIETMLNQQGYLQIPSEQKGLPLWGLEGNFSAGQQFNKEKTDSSFIFGGRYGQRWPFAFDDSIIVSSRNENAMRTIAAAEKDTMLSEEPRMQALLQALSPQPVKQLVMIQADKVLTLMKEPLGLMAIAQLEEQENMIVLLGLEYTDLPAAQAAEQRLKQSLPNAMLKTIHKPLSLLIEQRKGRLAAMRIEDGYDGKAWLLIPFQFTKPDEIDPSQYKSPFRLFVNIMNRRDMDWLQ
ncbi:MAG: hypothetical protein GX337_01805 [Christensenellaceae bacterium]|nr:hypothetical protein [Christensenellaceae bacterium]